MAMRAPASVPDVVVHRVLPIGQHRNLDDYVAAGGGAGRRVALDADAVELIDVVNKSGLRGRGGAGFPTGVKWSTVAALASESLPTTVVVNGAEGEPGTFKDRAILRANPYAVLEGAVIAARAVGAPTAVIALKATFTREIERVEQAIAEMEAAGWVDRGVLSVFRGPREYLYGEETALLESVAGRPPFPRIAPPWRRGVTEVVEDVEDTTSESGLAAPVLMAGETEAPPALVNNVETIANVPGIVANGADWFRSLGTSESPGTIVCTVSGSTKRAGVAEIPMGTPLRVAIETIGGGVDVGRRVTAVLMGVANAALTGDQLDTPLCYEAMRAAGSGLGSAGAIVFTDGDDLLAAAAGVSRFLAIESCGQCTPCKQDGLALAARLARALRRSGGARRRRDGQRPPRHGRRRRPLRARRSATGCSRQPRRPRRRSPAPACRWRHRGDRADARRRARRPRRRQGRLRRRVHQQAARLDLRRDRLGSVTRRPAHRQARRLTPAADLGGRTAGNRTAGRPDREMDRRPPRTSQVGSAGSVRASSASAAAAAVIDPARTAASISAVRRRTAGTARKRASR